MKAIFRAAGKQFSVQEGDIVVLSGELPLSEKQKQIEFEEVLAVGEEGKMKFGQPLIKGAKVSGEILEQGKSEKIVVYKYKRRKRYSKKRGHRDPQTKIKIAKIISPGGEIM